MTDGKPLIGLTSSYEMNETTDRIFLNHSYLDAIRHFGGIPLVLPAESSKEEIELLMDLCDGILLTGGVDINPKIYGEEVWNDSLTLVPCRDENEMFVCETAVRRGLPVLGICRGVQVMNVCFGGTLYQDIPTQIPTNIKHRMEPPYHRTEHSCILEQDSPYRRICKTEVIRVNSHHHQAIRKPASGFRIMATSEDGVIEGIYHPDKPFVWGVQWHPERIWDMEESSAKLFEAFVAACQLEKMGKS